jgi:hypothetical protein
MASPTGLEPVTPNLEGSCSILMSYGLLLYRPENKIARDWLWLKIGWSAYKDSNLGPPAPKAGALPGCATRRQSVF